jgi:hypothetical protein
VSRHIRILRDNDAKFVGQFSNLFVGLNENEEIVTWCLTCSTKFENFERRWKHVLASTDYEKTQHEIDKIKVHVRKRCLRILILEKEFM